MTTQNQNDSDGSVDLHRIRWVDNAIAACEGMPDPAAEIARLREIEANAVIVKLLREALQDLCDATPTIAQCETSIKSLRNRVNMQDPQWTADHADAERCLRFSEMLTDVRRALTEPKP